AWEMKSCGLSIPTLPKDMPSACLSGTAVKKTTKIKIAMIRYIAFTLGIVLFSLLIFIISEWIDWRIHRRMTTGACNHLAYGTYEDFVHQMQVHTWRRDCNFPE